MIPLFGSNEAKVNATNEPSLSTSRVDACADRPPGAPLLEAVIMHREPEDPVSKNVVMILLKVKDRKIHLKN